MNKHIKYLLLFIFISFICFYNVSALETNYDYEETKKVVKEVMKSYYLRGPYIQYHNSRRLTPGLSPEEATSQDTQYTVCSGYTYNVYNEAFGMVSLPSVTETLLDDARNYYDDSNSLRDNHYLLYYENTSNGEKYAYDNKLTFSDFVELVQPGDIFVFTGHAMIAYDVVTRENGEKDVLLLNSNGTSKGTISSRLYSTRALFYSYNTSRERNLVVDTDIEGGIQYKWLSDFTSRFVETMIRANDAVEGTPGHLASRYSCLKKQLIYYTFDSVNNKYVAHGPKCDGTKEYIGPINGVKVVCETEEMFESGVPVAKCSDLEDTVYERELSCQTGECAVIRPYYNCNGDTCFNYNASAEAYNKSMLRLEYPGIFIEKTVNKGDNNGVYPNDELEYTIEITNRSNSVGDIEDIKNYGEFIIEEEIDPNVRFLSSNKDGVFDGNKISWTITNLAVGATIKLKYKAKVKANISETITSIGKLYNGDNDSVSLTTGTINNKILPIAIETKNSYQTCYNEAIQEEKSNLELLDYVYSCARNVDFNFSEFTFEKLFARKKAENNQIYFRSNIDNITLNFKNMILNNYWGGATVYSYDGTYSIIPLKWSGEAKARKYTFNETDFKDGDILIYSIDYDEGLTNPYDSNNYLVTPASNRYTTEKGLYAFIYIDGEFVGINGNGETTRNSFTYDYYNDNMANLYADYPNLEEDFKDKVLKNVNYETLFDKDYYIILRPELVIPDYEYISKDDIESLTYIIGTYMFTRNQTAFYDGTLTTKRMMLASKTIEENEEDNMIIYYKKSDGEWINAINGETIDVPDSFKIKYRDLKTEIIEDEEYVGTEELSSEISNLTYVIGSYTFNRDKNDSYDGILTTRRIMLASKTIPGTMESDMIIYYKKSDGSWINSLNGNIISVPSKFKIKYKNLVEYN